MTERFIQCAQALLPEGWSADVCLHLDAAGMIRSVSRGTPQNASEVLDGPVIPGMPNLHSHGFQRLMAGLTRPVRPGGDDFWGWRQAMYRLAERITPEQLEHCLAHVYVAMLKGGYTSCAEFHYLHNGPGGKPYRDPAEMSLRVLAAADAARMPLTLLPVLYRAGGFGQALQAPQQRFALTLEQYLALVDTCRRHTGGQALAAVGVAPHSLRAVPRDELQRLLSALAGVSLPIHIHVAEQQAEVQDCLAHYGARPVEWLLQNFEINRNWCLVHATHMTSIEVRTAAATGAIAGLCPTTEADLGDGCFEARDWLDAGGWLGIGSDSNLRISACEELRLLEFTERLRRQRRHVLDDVGTSLYLHAARSGAAALGQAVGQLAPGCRADLVELDASHPLIAGQTGDEALETYVFAGGSDMIRSVHVAGECVVERGRHEQEALFEGRFRRIRQELNA